MESFVEHFKKEYFQKLITPIGDNPVRNRADSLLKVFEMLETINCPTIVETGCARKDHGELNFAGDGVSTLILDDFISKQGGMFYSVDINKENCDYARTLIKSHNSSVYCEDSVKFLYEFKKRNLKIDLLYCDSFDIIEFAPIPSQLHHLKEVAGAMQSLNKNALILVDDHQAFFNNIGKGDFVKSFMVDIGAKILHEGYQILFQLHHPYARVQCAGVYMSRRHH